MKIRNKKTGEVFDYTPTLQRWNGPLVDRCHYNSLAELNEEWEDYEEPKTFWAISWAGEPEEYDARKTPQELKDMANEIGNYFETREEAEKAVEKLKAWKRLKEQGFRFKTYQRSSQGTYDIYANWEGYMPPLSWVIDKDLNLLFGGEE